MDWSLMQPHAPHAFLRHDLGYNQIWVPSSLSKLIQDILSRHDL